MLKLGARRGDFARIGYTRRVIYMSSKILDTFLRVYVYEWYVVKCVWQDSEGKRYKANTRVCKIG